VRIRDLGIRVVVALHEPDVWVVDDWHSLGVRVVSIPTRDWVSIPSRTFDRVVDVISRCLEAGNPVLLHCLAGVNRAPTLAAAVLCHRHGLSVEEAAAAVRRARPSAAPTPEQRKSLEAWYELRSSRERDARAT
jgi:protein-tyrosine phosphatase